MQMQILSVDDQSYDKKLRIMQLKQKILVITLTKKKPGGNINFELLILEVLVLQYDFMGKAKILIVEDERGVRELLKEKLEGLDYEVLCCSHGEEMAKILGSEYPNVVLMDIYLPGDDGIALLSNIKREHKELPVIMITGHATVDKAVECMKIGAYDFLEKPFDLTRLEIAVKNAEQFNKLSRRYSTLESMHEPYQFDEMIGDSAPMQTIYRIIKNVSNSDATVFITGASGTGKELVAKSIHNRSKRAGKPFVTINCAAIPSELHESELFGHEKGSFTGAYRTHIGRCEVAHEGTLFLDEICDMSLALQVKLLRFLEDKSFHRIGGRQTIRVDVRVIAATNKEPAEEVEKGNFRDDLYYRLLVVPIEVPPLRERKEDIPLLALHFLKIFSEKNKKHFNEFSPEAMQALLDYPWAGNVRELENVIERIVVLNSGTSVDLSHLPDRIVQYRLPEELKVSVQQHIAVEEDKILPFSEVEKRTIERALKICDGNVIAAAKKLGLGQATIYRKIKQYDIRI